MKDNVVGLTLRIENDLRSALAAEASRAVRSLNAEIKYRLRKSRALGTGAFLSVAGAEPRSSGMRGSSISVDGCRLRPFGWPGGATIKGRRN